MYRITGIIMIYAKHRQSENDGNPSDCPCFFCFAKNTEKCIFVFQLALPYSPISEGVGA